MTTVFTFAFRSSLFPCKFNHFVLFLSIGTAAVCVAGILASLQISKMKLSEHKFMFLGAGEVCLILVNCDQVLIFPFLFALATAELVPYTSFSSLVIVLVLFLSLYLLLFLFLFLSFCSFCRLSFPIFFIFLFLFLFLFFFLFFLHLLFLFFFVFPFLFCFFP